MTVYLRGSFIREALARVIGHFASTSNSIAADISTHSEEAEPLFIRIVSWRDTLEP